MNYEHKILLYKMYKYKKSKGTLSLNFDKEAIPMENIERDMRLYIKR